MANTRVKVADAAIGRRDSYGLIYVPAEQALVCFGGCLLSNPQMDPAAAEAPYSEMTLNLEKGVWENRFPKGKEGLWGGLSGPAKAPAFPGSYYAFSLKDVEGNARPYLGALGALRTRLATSAHPQRPLGRRPRPRRFRHCSGRGGGDLSFACRPRGSRGRQADCDRRSSKYISDFYIAMMQYS